MKLSVASTLSYQVNSPGTLITSMHCMQTSQQTVEDESLTPSRSVQIEELALGLGLNRFARIAVTEPGPLQLDYSAVVTQKSLVVPRTEAEATSPGALAPAVIPYLFPSRYCPSDALREEASSVIKVANLHPYGKAEAVANWINANVSYVSGSTSETTDAREVWKSRQGVCRDFAHLGVALCRALTLPARYVTVYAHDLSPPDFHACFEVYLDGTWYLFDPTGLAPLNGMVRISSGRAASDTAVATLFGGVTGTGVSVSTQMLEQEFAPVTRNDLQEKNQAFILG